MNQQRWWLIILLLTLCGCIDQTEVQTVPVPTSATSSQSSTQESSSIARSISDPTKLIGNIDIYAPYQTLCPLGSSSSLINDRYSTLSCQRSDGLYLFLTEKDQGTDRFINVMLVPRNSNQEFLVPYMSCNFQGQFNREFLANHFILVKDVGNGDFEVIRVWRINFSTQQFELLASREASIISSCERAP